MATGLYSPSHEHDACGIGFIAHIKGARTHSIVEKGLQILGNLEHRGAVGADPLMGDGAGLLIQLPDTLYREEMSKQGVNLPAAESYGVGMVFLPQDDSARAACEKAIEQAVRDEGQTILGWRDVPVNKEMPMSPRVREKEPLIKQIFIGAGEGVAECDALERKLYVIRLLSEHAITGLGLENSQEFYICSMSARTVIYKGLLLADQVGVYFTDLQDERCVSALSLVHQRFSTNTFPEWPLAHPYRMVAHNGEINTVKGNFNWMRAREGVMNSDVMGDDLQKLFPLIVDGQSDTAVFDNALELLVMAGYPIAQAMMLMVPEAWENHTLMDESRRAFYEYHAAMMEPWDGPAAVAFTDGHQIGGTLDRNGLRPARFIVTDDDLVIMASESGTLDIPESKIVRKWRLQPGKMFLIDMEAGRIIEDQELKETYAGAKPYKDWIQSTRLKLEDIEPASSSSVEKSTVSLLNKQQAFGYTQEDIKIILSHMGQKGEEATGSMGNDSPLAVMSTKNKPLYNYFKQLFAQVTNPPIDPIREALVMSTVSFIGPRPNLLDQENRNPAARLEVDQPVLNYADMAKLRDIDSATDGKFKSYALDICYPVAQGKDGLEDFLTSLCAKAAVAIKEGYTILILSDRNVSAEQVAVPALLATSTVHQYLVREGLRTRTGLVVETGSAKETHHFALLAGYGAEAVHPYLAMETLASLADSLDVTAEESLKHFEKAINKGLRKIMSKMGISTYMSYCGAQIFEAIGLNSSVIEKYFTGTPSRVEGIGLLEVAEEALRLHEDAFGNDPVLANMLDAGGEYAFRVRGEEHMWTPDAIAKLQHATRANKFETYEEYAKIINDQSKRHMTLRGLFEFNIDTKKSISIDDVEPVAEIMKRFATGAMSLGSISTEAHTSLAIGMNRIGGKSNTGEGGEDPKRYLGEFAGDVIKDGDTLADIIGSDRVVANIPLKAGDSLRSRIKQVAAGRFGVTAEYLNSADQIQIKMIQGAKPGEGGQLPGAKVSEYIASLRFSVPGVGLISPPPHHDIYSIEDLAQLIHDLKNANPLADISVKLGSEVGVGTVAAGVAKAKSDHIVIAGHDGGTGASPQSSIKHAGAPWELGLSETQQTLVLNGLRDRVRVQTDGQIKTGRDVVIAALLGADEVGFATAPLVTQGCIMLRKCHLNTCSVGVATQDPVLREKFSGKPDYVVNYFHFVAEEARGIMAQLGARTFNELIGRTDLLNKAKAITHWKAKGLDFSRIFHKPDVPADTPLYQVLTQDHGLDKALDNSLIEQAKPALEKQQAVSFTANIKNVNRTAGTMLSNQVAKRYGHGGLPDDTIHVELTGIAGQSFAAFLAKGITFDLVGEGNDYVGKGLSGGRIIIRPSKDFRGIANENMIVGNTVLYGATCGEAYLSGVAGERFAVRNSGAATVIEGVGDHGCEYMTGGTVVVLGETGRNFAAGMSGGVAYVYDIHGDFEKKCNMEMVDLELVLSESDQDKNLDPAHKHSVLRGGEPESDEVILKTLIENHVKNTQSVRAQALLDDWGNSRKQFIKVFPREYKRALGEMNKSSSTLKEVANK